MGKRKPYTEQDAIDSYNDILNRCELNDFIENNRVFMATNKNGNKIFITPDIKMYNRIIENEKINDQEKVEYSEYITMDNTSPWIELDSDKLYGGDVININIKYNDHEFDIPIHKDNLPLRLKKAEFNNIRYAVVIDKNILLLLQKYFPSKIDGYSFYLTRIFKVI